jgi:hypothetical protein
MGEAEAAWQAERAGTGRNSVRLAQRGDGG